jgi:hypothetical protein
MRTRCLVLVAVALLSDAAPARADEFKPGYLQLTQLDHQTYDVLWKIPAIDESTTLKVKPQFPDGTEALTPVRSTFSRGITVQRWRIRIPQGLDGKAIFFSQLSETRIDVLVRLVRLDGTVQLERILPVNPSFVGRESPGRLDVVRAYTILGIEHILSGFHLLFVLALVLLVQGTRGLLVTITAFTAAHSLTLAGATLGWVHVPGPPVEASIAPSIVFIASEIVHARQGRYSARLVVLQRRRRDRAVAVRRSGVDSDRSRLARGTPASIVATRLDLAHRAACHWWPRELLAGGTSRRILSRVGSAIRRQQRSLDRQKDPVPAMSSPNI